MDALVALLWREQALLRWGWCNILSVRALCSGCGRADEVGIVHSDLSVDLLPKGTNSRTASWMRVSLSKAVSAWLCTVGIIARE